MKFYEITIKPTSGFGTPIKGDTLFGHFCWQAANNDSLLNGKFEDYISIYCQKPFAIFSSAFPKIEFPETCYVLKRPDMPEPLKKSKDENNINLQEKIKKFEQRKQDKKKKWMVVKKSLTINPAKAEFISDKELFEKQLDPKIHRIGKEHPEKFMISFSQPHNTINRLTNTTGTGMFAPYIKDNFYYLNDIKLAIFVLIDESAIDIEKIAKGLERIGKWGYGRDASTGLGKFSIESKTELTFPDTKNFNACYSLSPCVPEKDCFSISYFSPFVRFGKHGDILSNSKNPFKNPVIMADEGSVFKPINKDFFNKPYLGRAVQGVSKSMEETVVQGYSPYLPIKLEN
ncbi:MAG: hypothetical protein HQK76_11460 [Desulfobacterales bacterium]|nr:hypothetical protein [Desulfobacterales bacterium]